MMRKRTMTLLCLTLGLSAVCAARSNKVERMRRQVWAEWCRTCMSDEEARLPAPVPLEQKQTFSWTLPDTLEPQARMPFYYGTKGEPPASGYPLFLYLHGSGPSREEWEAGWQLAGRFEDSPSAYLIPRIPQEGEWYRWWQRGKLWVWERLLRQALAQGWADPRRIYILGISEGGYGSQRLASYYADYLAAAGPMAGGEPLRNAPAENLAHIGFSLLTGELDGTFGRNLLTAHTGRVLDSLAALHPGQYAHRVELVPGRGHGIDYTPTTPWLSRHTRQPLPADFRWENFELDGQRRNTFYNIEVLREDNAPGERTCYAYHLRDNEVDLQVSSVRYETTYTDPRWNIPFLFRRHLRPFQWEPSDRSLGTPSAVPKEALEPFLRKSSCRSLGTPPAVPVGALGPAPHGRLRIYFSEQQVDLRRPVSVRVNGRLLFKGRLRASLETLWRSAQLWGDPLRLLPAACEVEW